MKYPVIQSFVFLILVQLTIFKKSDCFVLFHTARSAYGSTSKRTLSASSSSSSSSDEIEGQMLSLQKMTSNEIDSTKTTNTNPTTTAMDQHLTRQQQLFDNLSTFFNSEDATPEQVKPLLSFIMNKVLVEMKNGYMEGIERRKRREPKGSSSESGEQNDDNKQEHTLFRILDVGCGVGALFPFYLQQANELNINNLEIVGLDLSSKMITFAKENADELVETISEYGEMRYKFDFVQGDFVQRILGQGYSSNVIEDGEKSIVGYLPNSNDGPNEHLGRYDAVVINACFGNFYDQEDVLTAASQCLKNDGILAITHPLGTQFVDKLKKEDPETVLHSLPSKAELKQIIEESQQPLQPIDFTTEIRLDSDGDDDDKEKEYNNIYCAIMKRVPQRLLRDTIYLRGPVDSGYGRGGKKLGIPTANLPCSLFSNALQNVPTGVYFGWAVIEGNGISDGKKGRNDIHKAVVNVGYSPTFDGEENKEKIVEAHLIVDDGAIEGDFYEEIMRLSLYGFLRPEMKFESFPALIAAIMNDKANANDALDLPFYQQQKEDTFLSDSEIVWIGTSGGDENASYQFGK